MTLEERLAHVAEIQWNLIGFLLDPVHHVHRDNLVQPLELIFPDGDSTTTPSKGTATTVATDPRPDRDTGKLRSGNMRGGQVRRSSAITGPPRPNPVEMLERADRDDNGRISRSEAPKRMAAARCEAMDADKDGFIYRKEMEAYIWQFRGQR